MLPHQLAHNEAERARLSAGLSAAGWVVLPSTTNFVLVEFGSREHSAEVAEALLWRGIVSRTFGSDHPLSHCLRFTVRNVEQDDRLIARHEVRQISPRSASQASARSGDRP